MVIYKLINYLIINNIMFPDVVKLYNITRTRIFHVV
jgi:hypothetical protein